MCNVAGHDDGALQVDASADGILGKLCAYSIDAVVQVYFDGVGSFACFCVFCGYQLGRIVVHLLQPDTVAVDLGLDVAVG